MNVGMNIGVQQMGTIYIYIYTYVSLGHDGTQKTN